MEIITRQGYTEIVEEFQRTGDNGLVEKLINYLETPLRKQTSKNLNRVVNYGYTFDDVYSLVLHTVWETMKQYDGTQGSDFLAYLKQRIHWAVNDQLIEKKGSLADKQYTTSISLSLFEDEEDKMTPDMVSLSGADKLDLSYNDDLILKVDYVMTYRKLLEEYVGQIEYVNDQVKEGIRNDEVVLNVIFDAVEDNKVSSRDINACLYNAFPGVGKATVRRRKKMATDRFGKFIKENI